MERGIYIYIHTGGNNVAINYCYPQNVDTRLDILIFFDSNSIDPSLHFLPRDFLIRCNIEIEGYLVFSLFRRIVHCITNKRK